MSFLTEVGTQWYSKQDDAKTNRKEGSFLISSDYQYKENSKTTKIYATYKNSKDFRKNTKACSPLEQHFYTIVEEGKKCSLFADLEWLKMDYSIDVIIDTFLRLIQDDFKNITKEDLYISSASTDIKGSLHIHIPSLVFNDINDQYRYFMFLKNKLISRRDTDNNNIKDGWFYKFSEIKKESIHTHFIDFGVYTKNRPMRLPYSSKVDKDFKGVRPFIPLDESDFDITKWTIVDIQDDHTIVDVSIFPVPLKSKKVKEEKFNLDVISEILKNTKGCEGLTIRSNKGNIIQLRNQDGINRICLINGESNETDNAYLIVKNGKITYHCHDEGCKGKSIVISEEKDEKEELEDKLPIERLYKEFLSVNHRVLVPDNDLNKKSKKLKWSFNEDHKLWQPEFIKEVNKYVKFCNGVDPYILERQVINNNVNWTIKTPESLMKAYKPYGHDFCKGHQSILSFWMDSIHRETYNYHDCIPINKDDPKQMDDYKYIFNTYDGFKITKEIAEVKGGDDVSIITDFIKKAWCNNKSNLFEYVIKWLAHCIQKPWIKKKTALVLMGEEGTGKGSILQIMKQIYGSRYFYQPSSPEDIFGSFNHLLDDKLFLFMDEVFWGGDKKKNGALKMLLSEEDRTSNKKGIAQRQVKNFFNTIMSSNESHVIPAGHSARRFTVLNISNYLLEQTDEYKKSIYDFCPYTFAKYLYNIDIKGFNGNIHFETNALKDQKMLSMCPTHTWILEGLHDNNLPFCIPTTLQKLYDTFMGSGVKCTYPISKILFSKNIKNLLNPTVCLVVNEDTNTRLRGIKFPTKEHTVMALNKFYKCDMYEEQVDSLIVINKRLLKKSNNENNSTINTSYISLDENKDE